MSTDGLNQPEWSPCRPNDEHQNGKLSLFGGGRMATFPTPRSHIYGTHSFYRFSPSCGCSILPLQLGRCDENAIKNGSAAEQRRIYGFVRGRLVPSATFITQVQVTMNVCTAFLVTPLCMSESGSIRDNVPWGSYSETERRRQTFLMCIGCPCPCFALVTSDTRCWRLKQRRRDT